MCRRVTFALVALASCFHLGSTAEAQQAFPQTISIAELPEGFSEKIVATGITGATAMAIAPDGRVFVCEQTGSLRVVKDDMLLEAPCVTVPVDSSWERGLIGVTLDPNFPAEPYVYLCYVAPVPYPHHRISRFTLDSDVAAPGSEVILLHGDDQTKLGGGVPNGHQGGAIHFGKDGKLYIAIGEQTAGQPSQNLDTFQGKLLRINKDGSIPEDNPFFKTALDKYRAIWAYGLRNPFAFAVQPGTGRILINDVGDARWEEINEGIAGANYGWPRAEGHSSDTRLKLPLYAYDRSQGKSITAGVFYNPPETQFPKAYVGKYFFAEFIDNYIRVLDPVNPKDVTGFATGLAGPVDLQVGSDGSLYLLNRNAWVKDDKFKPNTGSLHRIIYVANSGKPAPLITVQPAEVSAKVGQEVSFRVEATGQAPLHFQWQRNGRPITGAESSTLKVNVTPADDGAEFRCFVSNAHGTVKSRSADLWTTPWPKLLDTLHVGQDPQALPKLLSETGVFSSLEDLTPAEGILLYDVNSPLWSDGAEKRRWIALPKDTQIGFSERGAWKFPPGTVFIKHFELAAGEDQHLIRLETRLLVVNRRGTGYGVTYRWRADGSDADLLTEGQTEEFELSDRKQTWSYPSRNDCLVCHTSNSGFVLGVNTRQLNRSITDSKSKSTDNLLRLWNRLGLLQPSLRDEAISQFDRLVAINDTTATLEHRVRSYLDSNCAQCHRPGGTRGEFDARFETPLDQQKLVNGPIISSELGLAGAKLVVPGDPNKSMLNARMKRRQDVFNMPPLATHEVDRSAVAAVDKWVQSLAPKVAVPKAADLPAISTGRFAKVDIRVSEDTIHDDMECFKVETPSATYFYGKKGAGFAHILDNEGNDWVGYRPGNLARGEYRGLPKCGQPSKFFHCGYGFGQYKSDNLFTSRVTIRSTDHVRIESETRDGKSACAWDFYPSHATMTLKRIDRPTYWFLYEGTPGGQLNADKDFVIRPDTTKTTLDTPWSQVVPWVCFGANESPYGFICVNHQEPEQGQTDSYVSWPFEKEPNGSFQDMTVFGFGRKGYKELVDHVPDLKRLPARFSIGFISVADHETAKRACEAIRQFPIE